MKAPAPHLLLAAALFAAAPLPAADLVVVAGAGGEADYRERITEAAESWAAAGRRGEADVHLVGVEPADGGNDRQILETLVGQLAALEEAPLWIVLIGHGTYDGRKARFNLRGRDLEAATLARWLEDARRPVAVINCGSASAPFLRALSARGRVVVTATKSGYEDSYARFGEFLAERIDSAEADRDRDGSVSLLEAFLAASADVATFYEQQGRIATEEALIDDNGDGLGTPADWFRGVRSVRTAKDDAEPDGRRAHQLQLVPSERERRMDPGLRARRNELEEQLFALRANKDAMDEARYFEELERIARALADIYAEEDGPDS